MADSDNKLGRALRLGLPANRVNQLGLGDLDDLYRFTLTNRSNLKLSLSRIASGANFRIQIYALTRPLSARLKTTDIRKLSAAELRRFLRPVSPLQRRDLAAGDYFVRVFRVKGNSRYQLRMSTRRIVDTTPTPSSPPPSSPPPSLPPNPPPSLPPDPQPELIPTDFSISRNPNGPIYDFIFDFSKNVDADPAEDKGLFVGAVQGSITLGGFLGETTTYPVSNIASFKHPDGRVEYVARLFNEPDASTVPGSNLGFLFVKVILPASYGADPDSLLFLLRALRVRPLELYFAYGQSFSNGTLNDSYLISDVLQGGSGDDSLEGWVIYDHLMGGDGNDVLWGGSGGDTLQGENGNDTLYGEDNGDILAGGQGNDLLYGGHGDDQLYGNDGNDTLNGGSGADDLYGDLGNDSLSGQDGDDDLSGEDGDDRLDGGVGNDSLSGGNGNDFYVISDIGDVIYEYDWNDSGIDTVSANFSYTLSNTLENLVLTGVADLDGTGNDFANIMTGNDGRNWLRGGIGNDSLFGGLGNDTLQGEVGDDLVRGGDGDDLINDDWGGNDTFYGEDGDDFLAGWDGNDVLDGGSGNDDLFGVKDNDLLNGGDGNDSLDGGAGDDTLLGGAGNDTLVGAAYIATPLGGFDSLTGGAGADLFYLGDEYGSAYLAPGSGFPVIEDWNPLEDRIRAGGFASQYRLEFKNVIGSTAADTEIYFADGIVNQRIAIVKDTTNVVIALDFVFSG